MVSLVTLGVADIRTSSDFYEELGFVRSSRSDENIVWFRTGGTVLSLYPLHLLAKEAGAETEVKGFPGITLSLNMKDRTEVNDMVDKAWRKGGVVAKPPQETSWGGYGAYIKDPDGHLLEVAYNPFLQVDAQGRLILEE